jgi:hypothetical protein
MLETIDVVGLRVLVRLPGNQRTQHVYVLRSARCLQLADFAAKLAGLSLKFPAQLRCLCAERGVIRLEAVGQVDDRSRVGTGMKWRERLLGRDEVVELPGRQLALA